MAGTITPMLSYEDVGAAADWLVRAFGFSEDFRYAEPDGQVSHVELTLGGGTVMLGNPGPHYEGPRRHAEACERARRWRETPYVVDGIHAYVEDVDAHFAQAEAAGATILSAVEDTEYGDRHYRVEDVEGHRWMFAQRVPEVPGN